MLLRCSLVLCCLMLLAGPVLAAEIYGQIWGKAKQPPAGAVVTSNCGGETTVDQYGRYRLTGLPQRATCTLIIHYRKRQSNPANIYTANNPNSANFMLKNSSGRLLLIRR